MELPALAIQQPDFARTLSAVAQIKGANLQNKLIEAQLKRTEKVDALTGKVLGGSEVAGEGAGEPGLNMSALNELARIDPKSASAIIDYSAKASSAEIEQQRRRSEPLVKGLMYVLNQPQETQPMAYSQMIGQLKASGYQFQQEPPPWNPQLAEMEVLKGLSLAEAQKRAEAQQAQAQKAPTTREVKQGDTIVTQEFRDGKWQNVATGRRYKPQEGESYKPQTEIAKLRTDRKYLVEDLGLSSDAPEVKAIDRQMEKIGIPSGESVRTREMIKSGSETLNEATNVLMPGGKIDRAAVASAAANLPKTAGRKTRSQMMEATELMLRLETGAAKTKEEAEGVLERYMPSVMDDDETARDKLMRLQRRFENAKEIAQIRDGGSKDGDAAKKTGNGKKSAPDGKVPPPPPGFEIVQ